MQKDSTNQRLEQSFTKHPFTRRDFLSTSLKVGAAAFTTALLPNSQTNAKGQHNVLLIIVDDLRPLLGCYGHPEIHTPNIDALAAQGTLFNRAYCQNPLCHPSRVSMLTGLRPQTTKVLFNSTDFREKLPDAVTLPQYFKASGYHTQSVGKIGHNAAAQDDAHSWSVPSWVPPWISSDPLLVPAWQAFDVEDNHLPDGRTAQRATDVLEQIQHTQFFLAVGFEKPHLPFYAPRKYYELYAQQEFDLPATSMLPTDAPAIANNNLDGLRLYKDIPDEGPFSDTKTLELIRAYAASTSYMDAQVGRVLQRLDTLGLSQNTVVVFVGDHGFHLGEHGTWRKNTLFEVALHSPLIISVPGQQPSRTDALAELVDIYPTLCDACQLPVPSPPSSGLEGLSLMPVIEEPTRPWKAAAFSRLNRGNTSGRSMRTTQYRYTEWGGNARRGRELYDYEADPDETVNIADLPENAQLVAHLSAQLRAGWQGALPDTQEQIPIPQTLPWDINNDGIVNIQDLVLVSNSFKVDAPELPKVDVNKDGRVNILDLILVAAHFGESSNAAASPNSTIFSPEYINHIEEWLTEARLVDDGSDIFRRGIATLEHLINTVVPTETMLLPNYPNPFNPETWIPYDLARDADVHIHIYNTKGESVRQLSLGFQTAGTYRTRSRAAYWDGRNSAGEPVASGVYFYTLQAGQVSATRRMVILK
ncbi:MAG: sulfatase-like hydrolase/transferase [Candidatus Poribacteria bacterium]|nr:sulfatase-like hydrolase/transferase [Candidatus Poribacteria bacterium]